MTYEPTHSEFTIDPRGFLIERTTINGEEVILHYRDIPESDITTLHGIRLTTPLRTVIDLAPGPASSRRTLSRWMTCRRCSPWRSSRPSTKPSGT